MTTYKVEPLGMGFRVRGRGRTYTASDMKELSTVVNQIFSKDHEAIFLGPNPPGASLGVYQEAVGGQKWKLLDRQGRVLREWKGPHWIVDRDAITKFLGFASQASPKDELGAKRLLMKREAGLYKELVKLAKEKPEVRSHIVPLIKEARGDAAGRLFSNWYSNEKNRSAKVLLDQWFLDSRCRNGITSTIADALSDEQDHANTNSALVFDPVSNREMRTLLYKYILANYGVTKEFALGIAHQIVYGENY